MMRLPILAILALLAAACGDGSPPPQAPASRAPVVVYASYADENYLPQLFAAFTAATGIRVVVENGAPADIVARVIEDRGTPPADLLIAPGVAGAWRAADEGALRPFGDAAITSRVPERYRDADGYWVATLVNPALLVYNAEELSPDASGNYTGLGDERFSGRLCLSSSKLAINRVVIAMLIDRMGARDAELAVRGWVGNLALPPYDTESALLDAIDAGTCGIGIVSAAAALPRYASRADMRSAIAMPAESFADVEAIGIARHAREPALALELADWLLQDAQLLEHGEALLLPPANPAAQPAGLPRGLGDSVAGRSVAVAGRYDEDAVLLARRAGYR